MPPFTVDLNVENAKIQLENILKIPISVEY